MSESYTQLMYLSKGTVESNCGFRGQRVDTSDLGIVVDFPGFGCVAAVYIRLVHNFNGPS